MEGMPIWYDYATFDENGITGIREDAPQEAKDAYKAYIEEIQGYLDRGEQIPR